MHRDGDEGDEVGKYICENAGVGESKKKKKNGKKR